MVRARLDLNYLDLLGAIRRKIVKVLISILVFAPALGATLQILNPRPLFCRSVAIISTLTSAVAAGVLFYEIDPGVANETPRFVMTWMKSYSIHFSMGVDGINLLPMLATALIFPFLIISEWDRQFGRRGIHALLLILETAILGSVCSLDLFLLLFFFLMIPVPIYFLSSIWGDEGRESAAFRMISVSLLAGVSLFFGILLVYHAIDPHTFLIDDLKGKLVGKTVEIFGITLEISQLAFGMIVFALALRAPIWPVHGWFRKLLLRVPTTVGIAALLGGYPVAITVFTRIGFELFPETMNGHIDFWIGAGIANLIFGVLSLIQEKELRGVLVSLSTLAVGFSMIGIGTGHQAGLVGSQFILFSSIVALAIWGFSSEIIRHRARTYLVNELGGVLRTLPDLGSSTLFALACVVGIPGTAGFISITLLAIGSFSYHPGVVISGLVASAVATGFLIEIFRQVFLGERNEVRFTRLTFRERLLLFPLVGVVISVGFFPSPLVEIVRMTVLRVLSNGGTS